MAHHGKTSNTSPSQTHTGVLHGNFDILFNWLRALGVCFKIMWAVAMPSSAGMKSFYKNFS